MIKRILSVFLAFTLIFSITFTVNASTPESVITFTVEADTDDIAVGDTVTFTVKASATKGIYGVSANLEIPSGFTYVANSGKLVEGAAVAIGGDSGCTFVEGIKQIWLENASIAMTFNGTVSVATFDCVATTAGTYEISLTEIAGMDEDGGDLSTSNTVNSSEVVIKQKISGTQAITGVTAPVKMETADTEISSPENTTAAIKWYKGNTEHTGKFASESVYKAVIDIKANDGYKFASDVTFTVDGENWAAEKQANGSYKLEKTFHATAGKETPVCVAPSGLTATYGQKLSSVTLTNASGNTKGTWTWMTPDETVGNVGSNTFKAKFVPEDTENYLTVENIDVAVAVSAKNISVTIENIADQTYTGSQIKPAVTVKGDNKTLALNTDYTVEYGANINVGTGSVTVKSKSGSNYTFSNVNKTFDIVAADGELSISGDLNVTFGTVVPDVTVNKNGSNGTVTVYYYTDEDCTTGETTTKPTNAGDYWVMAKMAADANHTGAESNVLAFTISRADIAPTVNIEGWEYKSTANVPSVSGNIGNGTVTYKYKVKGSADSTYSVSVPTNAGDYTVKAEIAQTNNYNSNSVTKDFTITKKPLTDAMVENVDEQAYTGAEIKPAPVVTDGTALVNNTDFYYEYETNTYVGIAKVKVIGKGNYSGAVTKEFNITAVNQTPAITATASLTRDGHTVDLKPLVTNAMGDVSFAISDEANGCTIDNGVLTSGVNHGTVKVTVSITAKDVNGDTVNEYNAYTGTDAITVTVNDKATQAALNITSGTTVTCGQTLTLTSEGGNGDGAVTYAVTNGTGEATIEGNVLTAVKGGTVSVVATKAEDSTYNSVSSAPVTITIEKIKVVAPVADETVYTYNGTEQTYQLAENTVYTIAGNKQTNANETGYTVSVTLNNTDTHTWEDGSTESKNYTFVIKKATITITASDKEIYTGSFAPVLGEADYTVEGLVNGETLKTAPTIEYETTPDTSAAGTTVIKVHSAEAPEGGNYNEIVYTNGTLTITKKSSGGGGVSRYTVKFESNGGSNVASKTVRRNTVVEAPEVPTKDGYTFDGWYTDKELTKAYDFSAKVTKGFTLYAKWTEIEKEPVADETDTRIAFVDVKENDWFYENVQYVVENKLMNGVAEDKFAPNETLTRAMLVTVLYRNEGEPAVNKSIPFADVDMSAWYTNAVVWAKQNGIVNGVTENEFAPDENITREQIAAIMFRYAQYKGMDAVTLEENLHFADANEISEYAVSAMNWAVGTGLMKGKSTTTINPKDNATRAEIAAILQRFIENNK